MGLSLACESVLLSFSSPLSSFAYPIDGGSGSPAGADMWHSSDVGSGCAQSRGASPASEQLRYPECLAGPIELGLTDILGKASGPSTAKIGNVTVTSKGTGVIEYPQNDIYFIEEYLTHLLGRLSTRTTCAGYPDPDAKHRSTLTTHTMMLTNIDNADMKSNIRVTCDTKTPMSSIGSGKNIYFVKTILLT